MFYGFFKRLTLITCSHLKPVHSRNYVCFLRVHSVIVTVIATLSVFIVHWTDRWPLTLQLTITSIVYLPFSEKSPE